MGVASNRVDVKQAAARAERALETLAEPLAALLLAPARYPDLGRSTSHGASSCGTRPTTRSAPAPTTRSARAVLHRYAEATRIAEGVSERALAEPSPRRCRSRATSL